MPVSTWLSRPKFASTSHCQTVRLAMSGIAQTTTRTMFMKVRAGAEAERISSAKPSAPSIVHPAVQKQNATDFPKTLPTYGSLRMFAYSCRPTHPAGWPNCWARPTSWKDISCCRTIGYARATSTRTTAGANSSAGAMRAESGRGRGRRGGAPVGASRADTRDSSSGGSGGGGAAPPRGRRRPGSLLRGEGLLESGVVRLGGGLDVAALGELGEEVAHEVVARGHTPLRGVGGELRVLDDVAGDLAERAGDGVAVGGVAGRPAGLG